MRKWAGGHSFAYEHGYHSINPGDFITKVKQINSKSNLISMSKKLCMECHVVLVLAFKTKSPE